jgi:hypothetical protein
MLELQGLYVVYSPLFMLHPDRNLLKRNLYSVPSGRRIGNASKFGLSFAKVRTKQVINCCSYRYDLYSAYTSIIFFA